MAVKDVGVFNANHVSVDDLLKNSSADDICLEGGAKYLIDNNCKVFQQSIQTISRFSDQLYLEPTVDGLALKALNSSKSAFASILFTPQFFSECDISKLDVSKSNLCRISMRSALAIFGRGLSGSGGAGDNHVQLSCKLQIDSKADYLIAQISYTYFVTKCYVIPLRDCVITYKHLFNDKSKLRNRLTISARSLLTVLSQIGSDLDEVKIMAKDNNFSVERFFTTENNQSRIRKTAATIDLDCFELYLLQCSSEVAVNMKEFKAVLHFADVTGMTVNLHFDQPGRPIIVALEENIDFVADFVLATFEGNYQNEDFVENIQLTERVAQRNQVSLNDCHNDNFDAIQNKRNFNDKNLFEDVSQTDCNLNKIKLEENSMARCSMSLEKSINNYTAEKKLKQNNLINNSRSVVEEQEEITFLQRSVNKSLIKKQAKASFMEDGIYFVERLANDIAIDKRVSTFFTNGQKDSSIVEKIINNSITNKQVNNNLLNKQTSRSIVEKQTDNVCLSSEFLENSIMQKVIIDNDIEDIADWIEVDHSNIKQSAMTEFVDNAPCNDISEVVRPKKIATESEDDLTPNKARMSASPIYDCNLSCSPSAFLNGNRAFNIRLSSDELENLKNLNNQMLTQSHHESLLNTSYVTRLLDVAVKKTNHDSPRNSIMTSCELSTISSTKILENPEKATFECDKINTEGVPGAIFFKTNGSSINYENSDSHSPLPLKDEFLPNLLELDKLKNAVEQLKNKFGGFKERPNSQQFSQEKVDLTFQHHSNLFTGARFCPPIKARCKSVVTAKPLFPIASSLLTNRCAKEFVNPVPFMDINDSTKSHSIADTTNISPSLKKTVTHNISSLTWDFSSDNSAFDDPKLVDVGNKNLANNSCDLSKIEHFDAKNETNAHLIQKTVSRPPSVVLEEDYDCDGGWLRKPNTQNISQEKCSLLLRSLNPKRVFTTAPKRGRPTKESKNMKTDVRNDEFVMIKRIKKDGRWKNDDNLGRLRPFRKRPTLSNELDYQMSTPNNVSPRSVIVLTSPVKKLSLRHL